MNIPSQPFDIASIGKIASSIQLTPARIAEVAKLLGIEPIGFINGIPHWDTSAVERIAAHVRATERPAVIERHPFY